MPSIGHPEASYSQIMDAYERGCHAVTHFYSGMSSVHRVNGVRVIGVLESIYLLDDICLELIANGAHLTPELIRMIYNLKGAEHLCLVTDATERAGLAPGAYVIDGENVIVEDGVIKSTNGTGFRGSVSTMQHLVQTCVLRSHLPLEAVIRMAATNPAKTLGVGNRKGVLACGYDADIIAFDESINIKFVVARGQILVNELN